MASDNNSHNTLHTARTLMSNSATKDYSSPYVFHYSDNPSLVLVSQSLTSDNYISWSQSMVITLLVKNLGFIDVSIP